MSRRSYVNDKVRESQSASGNPQEMEFAPRRANKLKEFFGLNSIQKNLLPRVRSGGTSQHTELSLKESSAKNLGKNFEMKVNSISKLDNENSVPEFNKKVNSDLKFENDNNYRVKNKSALKNYIKFNRNIRLVGSLSVIMLMFITTGIVVPYYIKSNNSEATAGQAIGSTLTFSAESLTASVSLSNLAKDGTFATSGTNEQAKFSIATDNFTGYTLTMRTSDGNTLKSADPTTNTDTFTSIQSNISASTFSNSANTTYNNQWGIIPNYYYSNNATIANTDTYLKVPDNESITLDVTSAKNAEAKNYTIGIGARADYTNAIDTYSNTFILEYIANPVTYSITYNANAGSDTVTNMPATNPQTGSTSGGTVNSVNLTSNIPTRTGYTFKGWCSVSTSDDTCSGTIYNDQTVEAANRIMNYGIDQTIDNTTVNLYAMWSANSYSLAVTIGGSGISNLAFAATGETTQNLTASGTVSLKYGLEYTITATFASNYELDTWTETGGTSFTKSGNTATYRVAANNNGMMSISGKSSNATATFTAGSNIDLIMVADGSNKYKPQYATSGGSTSVTAAPGTKLIVTVVPKANYKLSSWSGTTTGLASKSLLTTTYTMPSSSNTLTAVGASGAYATMKDLTLANCSATGTNVTDERNGISYTVAKIGDYCYMLSNLRLAGGTVLSTTTSNVSSSYTLPSDTGDSGWTSNYCKPYMATKNNEYYYNWPAATARTNSATGSSSCSNDTSNSVGDICPYNWSLPTYRSDITISNVWKDGANPAMLSTTGYFNSGSQYEFGSGGYWWSSTRYNNISASYLYFRGISVSRYDRGKYYGYSVRCMLDTRTISNVSYMQDVNSVIVNNTAEGASATLTDRRDGKQYTVKKMDGHLIMTKNLAYIGGDNGTASAGNAVSANGTSFTMTSSTSTSYTAPYYYPATSNADSYGVYYNYCAASGKQQCTDENTFGSVATNSICPAGWMLPTNPNSDSWGGISTTTIENSGDFNVYAGYYENGYPSSVGSSGRWWSAALHPSFASNRYYLYIYFNGGNVNAQAYALRGYLLSVRCIFGS